ncbi:MAG: hypothetical protein D6725_01110, partial [Planctomycetota bacterium]
MVRRRGIFVRWHTRNTVPAAEGNLTMAESETPRDTQPHADAGESNAEQSGGPQAAQPSGERSGAEGGGAGRRTGGEEKSQQTLPPPTFES